MNKKPKCKICGKNIPGINYPNMTNYCSKSCMDMDIEAPNKIQVFIKKFLPTIDAILDGDYLRVIMGIIWKTLTLFAIEYILIQNEAPHTAANIVFILYLLWLYPTLRSTIRIFTSTWKEIN